MARRIFKRFPEARQVDKETPYNERRKMGHFSWASSLTSDQVIINLYVVHKVCEQYQNITLPSFRNMYFLYKLKQVIQLCNVRINLLKFMEPRIALKTFLFFFSFIFVSVEGCVSKASFFFSDQI